MVVDEDWDAARDGRLLQPHPKATPCGSQAEEGGVGMSTAFLGTQCLCIAGVLHLKACTSMRTSANEASQAQAQSWGSRSCQAEPLGARQVIKLECLRPPTAALAAGRACRKTAGMAHGRLNTPPCHKH